GRRRGIRGGKGLQARTSPSPRRPRRPQDQFAHPYDEAIAADDADGEDPPDQHGQEHEGHDPVAPPRPAVHLCAHVSRTPPGTDRMVRQLPAYEIVPRSRKALAITSRPPPARPRSDRPPPVSTGGGFTLELELAQSASGPPFLDIARELQGNGRKDICNEN